MSHKFTCLLFNNFVMIYFFDSILYENKNLLILFYQQNNNIKLDKLLVIQNILDHNKNIIHNIIYLQKKFNLVKIIFILNKILLITFYQILKN